LKNVISARVCIQFMKHLLLFFICYSIDTFWIPWGGEITNKNSARSVHTVKPSAVGFSGIGPELDYTLHRPYFENAPTLLQLYPTLESFQN
jgi:hypothetical protein